jgi:hypothetical protein
MLDRTIPFCNTIMKCSDYSPRHVELPDGFSIVSYQRGYEKEWAKLEYAIGDFDSLEVAEKYFVETYLQKTESFPNIYVGHGALPVYIHTQPWSWKAILLYTSLGFKLQKTDAFSHYENEYEKAMIELGKIVTAEQYELLKQSSEE